MNRETLEEIRNRNLTSRIDEELREWMDNVRTESPIIIVKHSQEEKVIYCRIGPDSIPFTLDYSSEPYIINCKDDKMSAWLSESNRYCSEQNDVVRSLNKSDIVFGILFPDEDTIIQVEQRKSKIQLELTVLRSEYSYVPKDKYDAALGCVLGGLVAEAAGATLEMLHRIPSLEEVNNALAMSGGGFNRVSPGQITDDGEMTIACGQVLINQPNLNRIAKKYVEWLTSGPFDIGGTTFRSLGCHNVYQWKKMIREEGLAKAVIQSAKLRNMNSLSNGCLMRASTLAIWCHKLPIEKFKEISFLESSLTNPNQITKEAVFCYRLAIAHLLNNLGDYMGAFDKVYGWAKANASPEVLKWLEDAKANKHYPVYPEGGHIRIGFIESFINLINKTQYYDAIYNTLLPGGDTDTNGMIVGALIGAIHGAGVIPETMKKIVLECNQNQKGRNNPRPSWMLAGVVPSLVQQLLQLSPDDIDLELFCENKE